MYEDILEKSGLKKGEAEIYDLLLQFGESPASKINSQTDYKRGMVYKFLEDLKEKGLVTTFRKNKKTHFRAEHPYKLLESIKSNLNEYKSQESILESSLPQLISSFNALENRPGVRIYEGIEGIKEIYMDKLREKKEIWAVLQTSQVHPELYKWLTTKWVKLRSKENIFVKAIVAEDTKTKDYVSKNVQEKRETRVVEKKKFPIGIEFNIYGDKVAFINFNKKDNPMGIIINNKLIADTMRAIFKLAWNNSKLVNKTS